MTLADFAGTWENASVLEGTTDTIKSTITGTAEPTSWTVSFEGRPNVQMTVSIVGDSLISQSAEYESLRRPGVMVSFRSAAAKQGEMLMGTIIATYKTAQGEEKVNGTFHGMKKAM
jgi:hypothetical protein